MNDIKHLYPKVGYAIIKCIGNTFHLLHTEIMVKETAIDTYNLEKRESPDHIFIINPKGEFTVRPSLATIIKLNEMSKYRIATPQDV